MTPNLSAVLFEFAGRLGQSITPDLRSAYHMGEVGLMAAVLMMAAEDVDRAADRLAQENAAVRALLKQGSELAPASLASRLGDMAGGSEPDIKVSTLQAANDALRAALIDLHAWVEGQSGQAAEALNAAIWRELSRSTQRRASATAPF